MVHQYLIEFMGTLFLTFVVLASGNWLAVGGALAIVALLTNPKTAINPAIALAYAVGGKIPYSELLPYFIAEVLGGLAAYQLVRVSMSKK
jgi:glycerol uptake facilitator-like aquaporin